MKKLALLVAIIFVVPNFVHAAVLINEVAWMGTSISANAEWLELTNSGASSVDLTGWKLVAGNGSPNITLSGSIPAGGYFLLERTSDDSVPGVPADQIYTGALTNSGTTLTLSDASNVAQDTVVGGTNWVNIGGDNSSKQTAQRTSTGWETAPSTPRAANAGVSGSGSSGSSGSSATSTAATTTSTTSVYTGGSATYVPPPSALSIDAGLDQNGLADVPLHFTALVKNKSGSVDVLAQISWNFGDGSSGTGTQVDKTYRHPGTYLVEVTALDGTALAQNEIVVTIAPAAISIESASGDGVVIHNASDNRLDLSGWLLTTGESSFRFPRGTWILPNSKVLFPGEITDLPATLSATLFFPNGLIAARIEPAPTTVPPPVLATTSAPASPEGKQLLPAATSSEIVQGVTSRFNESLPALSKPVTVSAHADTSILAPATTTEIGAAGAPVPAPKTSFIKNPWTLGFIGMLLASAGAFVLL